MIFVFYLMNLIFGLIIALPFRAALIAYGGNSLMGEKLAGRMDMDFLELSPLIDTGLAAQTAARLVARRDDVRNRRGGCAHWSRHAPRLVLLLFL